MLKKLTNNIGFKLLAIFGSIVLWMVVVSVEDPEMTQSFTVSVSVSNASYLTDNGKVYEILNDSDTIRVSVTARRSILQEISSSDFHAVADLSNVDLESDSSVQSIPIEITVARYTNQISMSARSYQLKISVEEEEAYTFPVEVDVTGEPADGYTVGDITLSTSSVVVSGPESLVSEVARVAVSVDVTNATDDFADRCQIAFYDADGRELTDSRLVADVPQVMANVTILMTKTVPVEITSTDTIGGGLLVENVTSDLQYIIVAGKESALSQIDAVRIDDIDYESLTESTVLTIHTADYLPEGVRTLDSSYDEIQVSVATTGQSMKTFTINTSDITVENLPEGMEGSFATESVTVVLQGEKQAVDALSASDLQFSVDASEVKTGTNQLEIRLITDTDVQLNQTFAVFMVSTSSDSDNTTDGDNTDDTDNTDTTNTDTQNNTDTTNGNTTTGGSENTTSTGSNTSNNT